MRGEYWFNSEPISKHIDIIFEKEKYQFVNEVVHLYSIDELEVITNAIKERIENKRPYAYAKEYCCIRVDFALCTIEYELPNQHYQCYIEAIDLVEILEKYLYLYEHIDVRFKKL